ncbi:glucose-1-phosphate thymidylyltransferase RfbA [Kiloniella sp. b19]|uniref:glucose-1-phosphate thymidylyltransferase RfbA n=1 Tax=Kiloniella sp. GXU_MW_B19 TaxID=3141326 RepID=UPI0031D2AD0A
MRKGIILAGGAGTRLWPLTAYTCKQLLPVYDKPLIYYPLTSLILAGIQDILIISTPEDTPVLQKALGDGAFYGVSIQYAVQENPNGLAEALIIGEEFLGGEDCCLILGDNILYRSGFTHFMKAAIAENSGATVFGFPVKDPSRFGVIETADDAQKVLSLEEKPEKPKSNLAAIGLYLYDGSASEKARSLKPGKRGELEITDLNLLYLHEDRLNHCRFSRGDFWLDAGLFETLNDASNLVRLTEDYTGQKIGCPEEAAFVMGNIDRDTVLERAEMMPQSAYSAYLRRIARPKGTMFGTEE